MMSSLVIVLLQLVSYALTTSPPDYSRSTEPVIDLTILHLEPARPALEYAAKTIAPTNGFIEIECDLKYQSVEVNYGNVNSTLKWVLPNPQMLTEERAYEKIESKWGSNAQLAITEFRPEDAGDYTCVLYIDDKETPYKKTLSIPALDGAPLLTCDYNCKRNEEEDCQIMEYAHVWCEAYGFPKPDIYCGFDECSTPESCPPPIPYISDDNFFGSSSALYSREYRKVFDELALKSGRHHCDAINYKGQSAASIFLPVSAGVKKTPGLRRPPVEGSVPVKQKTQLFVAKKLSDYYAIGEKVKLTCWTNENVDAGPIKFEWAFYNASTPKVKEPITNESHPEFQYTTEEASGGYLSEIVIYESKLEHGGVYECSAVNLRDGTSKSAQMVMETYRWGEDADMNQDRHVTAKTGSTVTMRCTVLTSKSDPGVRWFKDGLFVDNVRAQKSDNDQVLTITSVTGADSGVYTCRSSPRFALGVRELEGKTTLTVSDTAASTTDQITTINKAVDSLSTVQEALMSLSHSLSTDSAGSVTV